MKSALVKPQNARMSDSECGHVGLNACRFHVLKVSNAMHVLQWALLCMTMRAHIRAHHCKTTSTV